MPPKPTSVVLIVVITIALVALTYVATLAVCAIEGINPPQEMLSAMKDTGLVALGGLVGLLAKTSPSVDAPQQTINSPQAPVTQNTSEQ